MGKEFVIKDLGPLHFFNGIQATRNSAGFLLSQEQYIDNFIIKTKMNVVKLTSTPILSSSSDVDSTPFWDPVLYRNTVGAHQYATFKRDSVLQLQAYSNADWASDMSDRISTSGMAIFLVPNLIS
ncbi:uncharacterized protein LOC113337024 [Papaver somniferum]|uniref:uncharacterized protein LOC113337024 n=1 Tax=Papaver somniferum TaxID=3469 RepID=UPI000E70133A|nr:uncharacterized protein LOC113337024 [Papaver somniferum]